MNLKEVVVTYLTIGVVYTIILYIIMMSNEYGRMAAKQSFKREIKKPIELIGRMAGWLLVAPIVAMISIFKIKLTIEFIKDLIAMNKDAEFMEKMKNALK